MQIVPQNNHDKLKYFHIILTSYLNTQDNIQKCKYMP